MQRRYSVQTYGAQDDGHSCFHPFTHVREY